MKTFKIVLAILAISIQVAKAQFVKADLQVSGLTCSMCSKATEKSLRTLTFISDVKPDLNRNLFVVTFKKDAPVNLDAISKKVTDAGFSINKLTASFNFDNLKINNNYHFNYAGNVYHFLNVKDETLNGITPVTVIDKGFVPASAYKKYAAQTAYSCYKSGTMDGQKVYHVTI
ncbi:heavy-metal-associated domain-containing protein [uncultured Mucilaginibacter sp.]|uniref:heavy-metal-associated domain-containing protein n=1 Tax=uncultured Mucilaginibacter sp. TaxID=797541 RepID=UPI00260C2695|nr:heavy-metal-associated domain-containing protein [uncultured Mucilaginibacter sp.]